MEIKFNQIPQSIQNQVNINEVQKVEVLDPAGPFAEKYKLTMKSKSVQVWMWHNRQWKKQ